MTDLPLLAVTHGDRSVQVLQIVASASGLCRLLWMVDGTDPEVIQSERILRRFGTVVDIAGMPADAAAEAVAAHHPDGITTFRDGDIRLVAEVAHHLGLPFLGLLAAARVSDKVQQRQAFFDAGLPTPRWWEAESPRDAQRTRQLSAQVAYPVVVKPRSGSGSWHTFAASDAAEFVRIFEVLDAGGVADEPMIVEEYLPSSPEAEHGDFADYVSVETVVSAGQVSHLAVTGRMPLSEPFREGGFFLPSHLGPSQTEQVFAVATAALAALAVQTGSLHVEVKLTPAGPRVIEVNGRLGGGVPEMLSEASGVDLLRLSMRVALGEPAGFDRPVSCHRVGYRFFYQPPVWARRVLTIDGLDRFAELPGVATVTLNRGPGQPVDTSEGSRSLIFSVVGSVEDHESVKTMHRLMYETVHVTYASQ